MHHGKNASWEECIMGRKERKGKGEGVKKNKNYSTRIFVEKKNV
jgi:hypothetical protein